MSGIAWRPEEPVPMTPTRLPAKSTRFWGQLPVCNVSPAKEARPLNLGVLVEDRQPVAMMQNLADTRPPPAVWILQRPAASSKAADLTRVFS